MDSNDIISEALKSARKVQDYLWGRNREYDFNTWLKILHKRLEKLEEVDLDAPGSLTEVRKRLLQNAAVSIAWLEQLDRRQDVR